MKVKKTVCDVCGIELPVTNMWQRSTTRIKAKIKKINNEFSYRGFEKIKLDLCEQCLNNLCTNYNTQMESDDE